MALILAARTEPVLPAAFDQLQLGDSVRHMALNRFDSSEVAEAIRTARIPAVPDD